MTLSSVSLPIEFSNDRLSAFCQRWKVTEFAFFGSILRPDFSPHRDIDIMVAFTDDANWSLLDLIRMQQELEDAFRRPVDLVEKGTIRNPFRQKRIMESYQVICAA